MFVSDFGMCYNCTVSYRIVSSSERVAICTVASVLAVYRCAGVSFQPLLRGGCNHRQKGAIVEFLVEIDRKGSRGLEKQVSGQGVMGRNDEGEE